MKKKIPVVVEAVVPEEPFDLLSLLRLALEFELDIPGFEVSTIPPKKLRETPQNEQIILFVGMIEPARKKDLRNHPNVRDVATHPSAFKVFENIKNSSGVP